MYLSAPCFKEENNKNIKLLFRFTDYVDNDYLFKDSSMKTLLYEVFQTGLDKNYPGWRVKKDDKIVPVKETVTTTHVYVKSLSYVHVASVC